MTDDAIRTLQTDRDNFVLLLTDAARYMTAAGHVVKQTYPRLFHITYVAHGLHNAAERIRANYEDVDKPIAAVKASVMKNKDRRVKFSKSTVPATCGHQMRKLVEGSRILCQKLSTSL